ncbi:hypothetical protein [Bacillus toyonensis]|uniref:hypothetical protein n=1 Tax=Bacillus toyonensis TaxID=155322 RepID=UPI000BF58AF3|nr:hypothetical protein [Bacillus toyonensis]PGF05125.1 hypothetical protein COM61_01500 [Bacillus toyonensis]
MLNYVVSHMVTISWIISFYFFIDSLIQLNNKEKRKEEEFNKMVGKSHKDLFTDFALKTLVLLSIGVFGIYTDMFETAIKSLLNFNLY